MSFVKHVLLPEGQVVTLYLCDLQSKTCTEKVRTGAQRGSPQFRLAEHAVDRSYGRMSLAQGSCNVTIEFGGGDDLLVLITPAPASTKADEMPNGRPHPPAGCSQHAIVITGSEAWFRSSAIATPQPNQLTFDSVGLRSTTVHTTAPSNASFEASLPATVTSLPHIAVGLGGTTGEGGDEAGASGRSVGSSSSGSFGLSTAGAHTIAEVSTLIAAAREAELARYARFGDLAETKKVVQAAVMWTSVYNPIESGPFANVIRGNPFYLDNNAVNEDWDYVIFDWFVNSPMYSRPCVHWGLLLPCHASIVYSRPCVHWGLLLPCCVSIVYSSPCAHWGLLLPCRVSIVVCQCKLCVLMLLTSPPTIPTSQCHIAPTTFIHPFQPKG